jgi:hypothetical protein
MLLSRREVVLVANEWQSNKLELKPMSFTKCKLEKD